MKFKEIFAIICACYQVFLPVFLCILAGLIAAFALIGLYL